MPVGFASSSSCKLSEDSSAARLIAKGASEASGLPRTQSSAENLFGLTQALRHCSKDGESTSGGFVRIGNDCNTVT